MESSETDGEKPTTSKRKAEWFEMDESQNRFVYVSGLPTSMTEEEFLDLMKKYGIIDKKRIPGSPLNYKMYKDQEGNFKGDASCCYARIESVDLAIELLDGYMYDEKHKLKCERARFQIKGEYDPSKKPRVLDPKSKLKQKKKVNAMLSWEESEKVEVKQKKVILKNMFTPEELLTDLDLLLELREDVEYKCRELVTEPRRVEIFDKHPEGVVAVTFATSDRAEACVRALSGLPYAGRLVVAELWDGKTKYKIKETDEEAEQRLKQWHEDIQKSDQEDEDESVDQGVERGDGDSAVRDAK